MSSADGNPTILGGELIARWFYEGAQNVSAENDRMVGPPWGMLSDVDKRHMAIGGNHVIAQLRACGLLTDVAHSRTEIPANLTRLNRQQRGD